MRITINYARHGYCSRWSVHGMHDFWARIEIVNLITLRYLFTSGPVEFCQCYQRFIILLYAQKLCAVEPCTWITMVHVFMSMTKQGCCTFYNYSYINHLWQFCLPLFDKFRLGYMFTLLTTESEAYSGGRVNRTLPPNFKASPPANKICKGSEEI